MNNFSQLLGNTSSQKKFKNINSESDSKSGA